MQIYLYHSTMPNIQTFQWLKKEYNIDYDDIHVIRELEPEFEVVKLRVTDIEWSLYPFKWRSSDNPLRQFTTTNQWHIFEDILAATIISRDAGERLNDFYLDRLRNNGRYTSSSAKDHEYLIYKLEHNYICDIAEHYYKSAVTDEETGESTLESNILSTNGSVIWFVACGKYLTIVEWTKDFTDFDWNIIDVKYYWSHFWDKDMESFDTYTLDNYKQWQLHNKTQRYTYPVLDALPWKDVYKFSYHEYPKSKCAPSAKNPDNYLKRREYNCIVNIEQATLQFFDDIIQYYKLCSLFNHKPWWKIIRDISTL